MKTVDVFNGDADGICALLQYRLAYPLETEQVTGVKRDIALLERVSAAEGDQVNVFDISMKKNLHPLQSLMAAGVKVFYVDHHEPGEIPKHDALQAIIDTSATTCTSLLVNDYLNGQYALWAIVAAFGDNMEQSAREVAKKTSVSEDDLRQLKKLGTYINYNGYGSLVEDLYFPPDQLYRHLSAYRSPLDFLSDSPDIFKVLETGYLSDIEKAKKIHPSISQPGIAVFELPNQSWARRVSGVFGNQLSNSHPGRAHAILTRHPQGGYVVSVRAPRNHLEYAGELCGQFESGGGRKGAAGINHLPESELERFISLFKQTYNTNH